MVNWTSRARLRMHEFEWIYFGLSAVNIPFLYRHLNLLCYAFKLRLDLNLDDVVMIHESCHPYVLGSIY